MYWGAVDSGFSYTPRMWLGKTCIDSKYARVIEAQGVISLALLDVVPELANAVRRGPQISRVPSDEQVESAVRRADPSGARARSSPSQRKCKNTTLDCTC